MARVAHVRVTADELGFQIEAHQKDLMKRGARIAALDAAMATMRPVVRDSPVDLGFYKNAWTVKQGQGAIAAELRNDMPYAGIIELGARPHWPPFEPLYEWAKRKAGDLHLSGHVKIGPQAFRTDKKGFLRYRGASSLDDDDDDEIRRFVYAVQRKIATHGQKPHHVMGKHIPFAEKALARALKEFLGEIAGKKYPKGGGGFDGGDSISGL